MVGPEVLFEEMNFHRVLEFDFRTGVEKEAQSWVGFEVVVALRLD